MKRGDTVATLSERVKLAEHKIFPAALQLVASGTVWLGENGKLCWAKEEWSCLFRNGASFKRSLAVCRVTFYHGLSPKEKLLKMRASPLPLWSFFNGQRFITSKTGATYLRHVSASVVFQVLTIYDPLFQNQSDHSEYLSLSAKQDTKTQSCLLFLSNSTSVFCFVFFLVIYSLFFKFRVKQQA